MKKKRRGTIDFEELNLIESPPLVDGGNDYEKCVLMFLDELEIKNLSFHTRRWHKENLKAVEKALQELDLPLEPINLSNKAIKECILYWKREKQLSPTTINHRLRILLERKRILMIFFYELQRSEIIMKSWY